MTSGRIILICGGGVLLVAIGIGVWWANAPQLSAHSLQQLRTQGLWVHTLNSATTYYENRNGNPDGFEYDLAQDFAQSLGVVAKFKVHQTVREVLAAVRTQTLSIGAAGISVTAERQMDYRFGPKYLTVQPKVVCHRRRVSLPSIRVTAESSYVRLLEKNGRKLLDTLAKQSNQSRTDWDWAESDQFSTQSLLEQVNRSRKLCTVADSNILDLNRRFFPNLQEVSPIGPTSEIAWLLNSEDRGLQFAIRTWFKTLIQENRLQQYLFRHFGFVSKPDPYGTREFLRHRRERLPKFLPIFKAAAKHYGFHWTTLAAMAYQESQWSPLAISPTGVKGMMMLTRNTAASVGVGDRLDAGQSIWGGARYLQRLQRRLPPSVRGRDRLWLALAAYNVGYGHLLDAIQLAQNDGLNPNRWETIRRYLPLLSDTSVYATLKHGYARGQEPVQYVSRVRDFQDRLQKTEQKVN